MVKAIIDISPQSNAILNVLKAKHGLNTKSEAIDFVVKQYEEEVMEPALRPDFIKRMRRIEKGKKIYIGTVENLRKRFE